MKKVLVMVFIVLSLSSFAYAEQIKIDNFIAEGLPNPKTEGTSVNKRQEACVAAYFLGMRSIAEKITDLKTFGAITEMKNIEGIFGDFTVRSDTPVEGGAIKYDIVRISYKGQIFLVKDYVLVTPLPAELKGIFEPRSSFHDKTGIEVKNVIYSDVEASCKIILSYMVDDVKVNREILKTLHEINKPLKISVFPVPEPPKEPILRIETGMHTARISRIGIDAENRYLVTASYDKTVRVWDMITGRLLKTLRPPIGGGREGRIYAVAISPDGKTIATGGETGYEWDDNVFIYLFDRETGNLIRKIPGLPKVIMHLAYSKDGRFLVATLASNSGIRIYETSNYSQIGEDKDYGDDSFDADFDGSATLTTGRLVTTSWDGYIRLYDRNFRLIAKKKAPGGNQPHQIHFSPDGSKVAVGFSDSTKVDVLDVSLKTPNSKLLTYLYSPDTTGVVAKGDVAAVSWSSDGRFLYAGGGYQKLTDGAWHFIILKWENEGKWMGKYKEIITGSINSILHILPIKGGGIAFGAGDPGLGIINNKDERFFFKGPSIADFRSKDKGKGFLISYNGSMVQFGYEYNGKSPASFSVKKRLLDTEIASHSARNDIKLTPPITSSSGLEITDWEGNDLPKLNGKDLKLMISEECHSLAISPDGKSFLLGTEWMLRLFDRDGNAIWRSVIPDGALGVNISGDGRLAVAAFRDGTIRWYRMSDGQELLAFFPHKDKKRWVMWTPEGFFDSSEESSELIGYHLNQGKDKEAAFIPIEKLYNVFYRPDLVLAKLEGKDISEYAKAIDINKLLAQNALPPKVRFITQTGKVGHHDTTIKAELCDTGGGIGNITLYLDDMPVSIVEKGRGIKIIGKEGALSNEKCYSLEHIITLQNGKNRISLMAYNKENTIESNRDSIELNYKSSITEKPSLHVLLIAVDKYRDIDLRLKYSINDAEAMIKTIKSKSSSLFEKVEVHTLYDAAVTKEGMSRAFEQIGKKTKREDVFLFFLAGHGITFQKDGSYYYLPVDFRYTEEEAIQKHGVSMDDFKQYLTHIQATKSLLLLDTCNSGSFAEAVASRGLIEKTAINKLTRAVGRATIVASSKSQVALEGYEGHGVFTYTVLEALSGNAADKEGKITINGIATYVEELLPKLTYKKWGYEQIPQKTLQGMDFPIGWVK